MISTQEYFTTRYLSHNIYWDIVIGALHRYLISHFFNSYINTIVYCFRLHFESHYSQHTENWKGVYCVGHVLREVWKIKVSLFVNCDVHFSILIIALKREHCKILKIIFSKFFQVSFRKQKLFLWRDSLFITISIIYTWILKNIHDLLVCTNMIWRLIKIAYGSIVV